MKTCLHRRLPYILVLWSLTAATLLSFPAHGEGLSDSTDSDNSLTLHGFGTLGLARSTSSQAEFVRDLSQPKGITNKWSGLIDSVLGVQAQWRVSPGVEMVGQLVSRWHYDHSQTPEVMWAFAKWEPDARVSLRAGRIGADFMMLADSRLVGYSYLPVRPPSDFFGTLFFSHLDGADASLTLPVGNGLLRGKVFAGATQEKTSGAPGIWDTSGSPVRGFVLDYQKGPWLLRANMASIRFSHDINYAALQTGLRAAGDPAAADLLSTSGTTTTYYSMGVVYDEGPLQVQGMINQIHHEAAVFQNSQAAYVQAGYRLGVFTPYAGLSRWISTYKDYQAVSASAEANGVFDLIMHASAAHQTTYTVGVRWDIQQNWAAKLQWDAIRGNAQSRFPFANPTSNWDGRTNVLSMSLDFVF
jgi:hypothetical protein